MNTFITQWHTAREKHNSNIVAGCDPSVGGRKDGDSLPEGVSLYDWCMRYVEAVAPFVAGVKCNPAYFQTEEGIRTLRAITDFTRSNGLVSIVDCKASDIGSTNDAWFKAYKQLGFDATTIAPYAGNIEGSIRDAHQQGIGAITMGFMSNPEYATEMFFSDGDTTLAELRVKRSILGGADGIVVGATKNPKDEALHDIIAMTNPATVLYLVPGIGAQGGSVANIYAAGIAPDRAMLAASRSLMFPDGATSSSESQARAAKALQEEAQHRI